MQVSDSVRPDIKWSLTCQQEQSLCDIWLYLCKNSGSLYFMSCLLHSLPRHHPCQKQVVSTSMRACLKRTISAVYYSTYCNTTWFSQLWLKLICENNLCKGTVSPHKNIFFYLAVMVSSHADGFWFCLPTLRYPSLSLLSPAHKSGREWNFICVAQCHICHVYVYTWHICYTKFYCIINQTTQSFGTLNQICGWLGTTKYMISSSCFSIDYINWPFFNVKDIPIHLLILVVFPAE